MSDEEEFVSGYADFERAGMAIGIGSMIAGKSSRLQQIIRAQTLSPKDRFMEGVQYVCYTENQPFPQDIFEAIASKFSRPQYLNPRICVYVVNNLLITSGKVRIKDSIKNVIKDTIKDSGIYALDAYRYATIIVKLLN